MDLERICRNGQVHQNPNSNIAAQIRKERAKSVGCGLF